MSTRTTTTKSSVTSQRGRGGRGRGRGGQSNSNRYEPNSHDEDVYQNRPYNERRSGQSTFTNRGNYQPRNRGNFRGNNRNVKTVGSADTESSPSQEPDPDRIPRHLQNPFFKGELMSRFNNMVRPPSFLEDEAAASQQPLGNVSSNRTSNIHTLDSVRSQAAGAGSSDRYNGYQNKTHHEVKRLEASRNKNQTKPHVQNVSPSEPRGGIQQRALANTGGNRKSDTPTLSNKSMSPVGLKNISSDKREAIIKSYGFKLSDSNSGSDSQSEKSESPQKIPVQNFAGGVIAGRTTPRVRFNLEYDNEPKLYISPSSDLKQNENDNSKPEQPSQKPSPGNAQRFNDPKPPDPHNVTNLNPTPGRSSDGIVRGETANRAQPSALSESFFSTLDTFASSSIGQNNVLNPTNNGCVRRQYKQERNVNKPPRNAAENFKPFLKTNQTKKSQNYNERSRSPKQRYDQTNHSPALFQVVPYDKRLTKKDVTGGNHFGVQRPVRDANERVPSRSEALKKFEEQYEIQRAEHEAKKREKEAKKREEYLARYKHVDQGYRLNEGLLDEAAGYAPGYSPVEAEEEVRRRQQEQLRQDALRYQEQRRLEEEKQRRKEEQKIKEKLEKNKHIDAGYRLGGGDRENSELLLEAETEEEALQRQEEQLILEMLIQEQSVLSRQKKPETEDKEDVKELKDTKSLNSAKSESMNPFLSSKSASKPPGLGSSRNNSPMQLNRSAALPSSTPGNPTAKSPNGCEGKNKETGGQIERMGGNIQIEPPSQALNAQHLGTKRQSNGSQVVQQEPKISRNFDSQVSEESQKPGGSQAPASCVLKSRNGAVLVLRPTHEDLNRALARKLEVQDEVDKLGHSALYNFTPEQTPVYMNNRFERRPGSEAARPSTGAIPKASSTSAPKPVTLAAAINALNGETAKQEEPPVDLAAEMRAARLRMQQQYEQALKKKQEEMNASS